MRPDDRSAAAPAPRRECRHRRALPKLAVLLACAAGGAQSATNLEVPGCGNLSNAFGPFDYRVDRGEPLQLVESAHFGPLVEGLIRGQTGQIGGDLDYTLRAFPNHHRALVAAARYADRMKTRQPFGFRFPVDCWFERAVHFKPDDLTARMLYAQWLSKHDRRNDALRHLQFVEAKAGDNPLTHYNLGLLYLEMGEHPSALKQAHIAEAMGMQRQELKNGLKAAGKWVDPAPEAAAAGSAPAETASSASAAEATRAASVP